MSDVYSNKWGRDFAGILKAYEQDDKIGLVTGEVVKTKPFTVSIFSGDIILNPVVQEVFMTETLRNKRDRLGIKIGDKILVAPNEQEKVFYMIDLIIRE